MALQSDQMTRLVVLISGNGTNLQALIDACSTERLPFTKVVRVICNRKDAFGLERAKNAQIPTTYHNIVRFRKKNSDDLDTAKREFDAELAALILAEQPHLVVCAGWMIILSGLFVSKMDAAQVPVINLHPSLPGPSAIKGANAIQRAYEAFQRGEITKTGVTIHYLIEEVDAGDPIISAEIPILKTDSLADLEQRIHSVEWGLIVEGTHLAIERLRSPS